MIVLDMIPGMVPSLDPNPLPAPYWVFKLLLVVTFFLHIVAMNLMLGGAALALCARWRKSNPYGSRIFLDVAKKVPTLLAATISLGIAPLLFVQVVYGQFFYTSSILIAWPWLLVIALVIAAYYGFYYVAYKGEKKPVAAGRAMLFSTALILLIGFIYTNNITLGETPARWAQAYFSGAGGWRLNLGEPTLVPRYLHFMISAVAVGGLLLVLIAWAKWKKEHEYAREIFRFGGKAFMYANMAQFVVGIWFLLSLPRQERMVFMGASPLATGLLGLGLMACIAIVMLMSVALKTANIRLAAIGVTSITAVTILAMTVMRDILRDAYLKPWFHPHDYAVKTQWSPFLLFLGLFVAGIALWVAMMWKYGFFAKARAAGQ